MTHKIKVDDTIEKAYQIALKAQKNSYSPYSHFAVGAAIKFKGDDKIYPGCNVENASYGGTNCAERTAVFSKVAESGHSPIEYVVVIANTENPTPPCALCLQIMNEFCETDFPIYMANDKAILKKMNFKEFLPYSFDTLKEGQKP